MKRSFAAIAVGVVSAVVMLSTVACAPAQSALQRAQEMKSERLDSSAAWEAAFVDPSMGAKEDSYTFNGANYSIESETVSEYGGGASEWIKSVIVRNLTVAGERLYSYENTQSYTGAQTEPVQSVLHESYYMADETRYKRYFVNSDGAWEMTTVSSLGIDLIATTQHTGRLTDYKDAYEEFTWSDEQQGYCKEVEITGFLGTPLTATLTLKFQSGRLAAMLISHSKAVSGTAQASVTVGVVITYGGRSVKLPTV